MGVWLRLHALYSVSKGRLREVEENDGEVRCWSIGVPDFSWLYMSPREAAERTNYRWDLQVSPYVVMIFICEVIIRAITALSGYPYLDSYADSTIHDVRWCLMKADSISLSARYIIRRAT